MEILTKALDALWQVLLVGPSGAPRAIRPRTALPGHRTTVTVGGGGYGTADDASKPSRLGIAGAVVCFSIAVLAVLFGIVVIIFGNQIFG